jgi:uncharacterized RDD family membrane protein YckC
MKNKLAHPLIRFLAFLVDRFVFLAMAVLFFLVNPALIILWLPISGLIEVTMTSKFGGSIGQLLIGIRVVDSNEKFISFNRAFFRAYVGAIVSGLLFGLGYLWMFWDPERRGWHDKISGTIVVKV